MHLFQRKKKLELLLIHFRSLGNKADRKEMVGHVLYTRNGHFSPDTYCSVGDSCSTAGERIPHNREAVGWIPARCWAFFSF